MKIISSQGFRGQGSDKNGDRHFLHSHSDKARGKIFGQTSGEKKHAHGVEDDVGRPKMLGSVSLKLDIFKWI